jgi:hypothetical protein
MARFKTLGSGAGFNRPICSLMRFLSILFLLFIVVPARAQYFVSLSGDDKNNCFSEPCKTWRAAIDKCSFMALCHVWIAAGTYHESPSNNYYKFVNFVGDCNDLTAVHLDGILMGQDHSITGIGCATVSGIMTRQFAIMDYHKVRFVGGMADIVANEHSKINCLVEDNAVGGGSVHFAASDHSTISAGCNVKIVGHYETVAAATQQSMINAGDAVIQGEFTCSKDESSLVYPVKC